MADTTPQGSTVQDAANAIESLLDAQEAKPEEVEAQAEEVPEAEAPQEAEATEEPAEDDQPQSAETPALYTVKVNGEERQVPVEELVKGYQFDADYRQKTMDLAAKRKAAEETESAARAERQLYAQLLPAIQAVLIDGQQEPDWDKLFSENPTEAVQQKYQWDKKQQVLQQARAEQQRLQQVAEQERQQNMQKTLAEESTKLLEAIPEWKDKKTAEAEKKELLKAAITAGYSEQDLATLTDHRAVVILRKAALYDKMQSAKATLRPAAPQVKSAAPSSNKPTQPTSELTKAKQRLAKTGSVRDAALAIEHML